MTTQENIQYTSDEIKAMVKTCEKYNKAVEIAKECLQDGTITTIARDYILEIFPDLKVSEDERIRKAILELVRQSSEVLDKQNQNNMIAWLEKLGKQTHAEFEHQEVVKANKQELEPKFHPGDWVIDNFGNTYQIESATEIISEHIFGYTIVGGGYFNDNNHVRLWSIQDAEDGDVLVASDGSIFLFAGVDDCACKYYVALTTDNYVKINKETKGGYWETSRAVYPATKEQRDLLFQKMDDAGYEWDSEKKELKKAEPEFHEGDWAVYNNDICQIVKREEGCNKLVTVFGIEKELVNERFLSTARLWTIQDAKDGDVLATPNYIYIFNSVEKETETVSFYCLMKKSDEHFSFGDCKIHDEIMDSIPATKEQRDLLFQKMKEAGYEWNSEKKELKKIEPNLVDNVETKFKVGQWFVNNITNDAFLIKSINNGYCTLEDIKGNIISPCLPPCENDSHLWTIADAKDGDVLVDVYGNIGIFDKCYDFDWMSSCSLGNNGGFQYFTVEHENEKTYPATKEQRDLFFSKMKEAGWEWDSENKELNKVEVERINPEKVIEWLNNQSCRG